MTRIVDSEGRITLPPTFHAGDVVEVEARGKDEVMLKRTKSVASSKPHLVQLDDGFTVIAGGPPITNEDVKRALEDFP